MHRPRCVVQGQALPTGLLLVWTLSLLTNAFKSLYSKGTSTQTWLYTDMFSSLMFCCASTEIAWPCRDDANTMEVMLNAKVPGWSKQGVKVSPRQHHACCWPAADAVSQTLSMCVSLRRCRPITGPACNRTWAPDCIMCRCQTHADLISTADTTADCSEKWLSPTLCLHGALPTCPACALNRHVGKWGGHCLLIHHFATLHIAGTITDPCACRTLSILLSSCCLLLCACTKPC